MHYYVSRISTRSDTEQEVKAYLTNVIMLMRASRNHLRGSWKFLQKEVRSALKRGQAPGEAHTED
jgi:hypothetical protein